MSESISKIRNLRVGIGRLESNYIATNPLIFEQLKIGDMLICIHKDDYFRMQEGITELLQHIITLHELIGPKMIKELRIKQLKDELSDLEND